MASQFPEPDKWKDNWLSEHRSPSLPARLAFAAGRANDLARLVVVGGLGLLLLGGLFGLLLLALVKTSLLAALLVILAMASVVMALGAFRRRTRQVAILREAPLAQAALGSGDVKEQLASLEAGRIQRLAHLTLRSGAALNPALRSKLNAASTATRDALRSTAVGGVLTREAHDARQAADDDLPAALATYQDLRVTGAPLAYGEVLLAEQLGLIERRMRTISEQQAAQHTRKLEAGKRYLSGKYGELEDPQE